MNYAIDKVVKEEYPEIMEVWEASVRATHYFLNEGDIAFYKSIIFHQYLDAVELICVRNTATNIVGFGGVSRGNLEMLFIQPIHFGEGIGHALLQHAINHLEVKKVDVNEQNELAVGFYLHEGFREVGRSEVDALGKPYPILHLELIE